MYTIFLNKDIFPTFYISVLLLCVCMNVGSLELLVGEATVTGFGYTAARRQSDIASAQAALTGANRFRVMAANNET